MRKTTQRKSSVNIQVIVVQMYTFDVKGRRDLNVKGLCYPVGVNHNRILEV